MLYNIRYMEHSSRVAIVGAGELGQAVGYLFKEKKIPVDFWDANLSVVPGQRPLKDIIPTADHVLFCVPSWATRAAVTGVLPYLKPGATVISFAKGIEKDSLQTMAEMVPTLLPKDQPFVVVGGPMLAAEIMAGNEAVGVFASKDKAALAWVTDVFGSDRFRVETTEDLFSVSLAGTLKNIYATALGVADGLRLSGNEKGWVASRSIDEMVAIAAVLGADREIFLGSAGVGDLIATGYSVHSRNRKTGIEIVATSKCDLRSEGLNSLPFLMTRLGMEQMAKFPLLTLISVIGLQCQPSRPLFDEYFHHATIVH